MDPTKMLEADHREAEDLFAKIKKLEQGAARTKLVHTLDEALRAHMKLEEKVVYPPMQSVTGAESVKEGTTEHDLARKALADVVKLCEEPGFGAALDALEAGIAHHVEEEETEMFPKMRQDGEAKLNKMATPFMQMRMELGMEMPAAALASAFSKEELCAEAEQAGVDNASSMKKDELANALAAKMAS